MAAVGNHEAKALTFLSMEPGVGYGVSALHHRFLDIQGPRPVFVGTVSLQQKYCIYSFEPAGLVRLETNDKGFIRHVKDDAGGIATALAGHLLAVFERRRVTLSEIFGKTAVNEAAGADAERSPIRRLTLLHGLLDAPVPAHQAHIARRTGLREMTVGTSAAAMAEVGLLGYKTQPTYMMKSRYQVTRPLPTATGGGNYALHNAAVAYINSRWMADSVVITRDEVEAHLRTLPRWQDSRTLRDVLQRVMVRLTDHGHIVPVQDFVGHGRHTVLTLTARQRRFLEDLVSGIDAIAAGDRQTIKHSQDQARRIISDPARVRRLITKAYGASKLATNPISAAEKQRRILAILRAHNGATTEMVTTALSPDLTKNLVAGTLAALARAGKIRGEKQPDGPYKRWLLT